MNRTLILLAVILVVVVALAIMGPHGGLDPSHEVDARADVTQEEIPVHPLFVSGDAENALLSAKNEQSMRKQRTVFFSAASVSKEEKRFEAREGAI